MREILTERIPIKMWLDDIEEGALDQAKNLANFPFAQEHIAIMPDSHQGYGMPIGAIMITKNVIIPNAVGVDIGCGMVAIPTNIPTLDTETIKRIMGGSKEYQGGIRSMIPMGFSHHSKKQAESLMPLIDELTPEEYPVIYSEYESARKQVGTLGGGNHFIELQEGSDGFVWIMVHSGSRNLGFKVANHYNKLAEGITEYPVCVQGLSYLYLDMAEGRSYVREMNYCIRFAEKSRMLMLTRIMNAIDASLLAEVEYGNSIDVSHNYAIINGDYALHRKGAISAEKGEHGIIPGSQGTPSYITIGKGNPESFCSSSHGAGRKMSRSKAKKELNLEHEQSLMNKQGIIHGMRNVKDLDEASGAYKDIEEVMENQTDLTELAIRLKPIAVMKG